MHWGDIGFFSMHSEVMRTVRNSHIEKSTKTRCTLLILHSFRRHGGMFHEVIYRAFA